MRPFADFIGWPGLLWLLSDDDIAVTT